MFFAAPSKSESEINSTPALETARTRRTNLREHFDHALARLCGRLEEQEPGLLRVGLRLFAGNLARVLRLGVRRGGLARGGGRVVRLVFRLGGGAAPPRARR